MESLLKLKAQLQEAGIDPEYFSIKLCGKCIDRITAEVLQDDIPTITLVGFTISHNENKCYLCRN